MGLPGARQNGGCHCSQSIIYLTPRAQPAGIQHHERTCEVSKHREQENECSRGPVPVVRMEQMNVWREGSFELARVLVASTAGASSEVVGQRSVN